MLRAAARDEAELDERVEHVGDGGGGEVGGAASSPLESSSRSARAKSSGYWAKLGVPGRWVSRPRSRRTATIVRLNDVAEAADRLVAGRERWLRSPSCGALGELADGIGDRLGPSPAERARALGADEDDAGDDRERR